jgi:hypothetical protein
MLLEVGVGFGAVEGSTIMLVPTTKEVRVSVEVAMRETIGEPLLVDVGMIGIGIVAEPL